MPVNGKTKSVPMRRCVGCMGQFEKKLLIRVVRAPDGTVSLDFSGKKSGRGAYICKSTSCLKKAIKSKRLEKNLECAIPEEVYNRLEGELSDNE